MIAGDNEDVMNQLLRTKTPEDLGKRFVDLTKQVREKAPQSVELAENATPEQLAEYREAKGIPAEGTMEAYGVKIPEDAGLSDADTAMIGAYVESMHSKNATPGEVQNSIDEYMQIYAAQSQEMNTKDLEYQKASQSALKEEFGADYEAYQGTAEAQLGTMFGGNEEAMANFLNARMPDGGRIGDAPEVFKMLVDMGLQNGLTDRIEANQMEANGKSIMQQISEIEGLMSTDRAAYDEFARQGGKLDRLYNAAETKGIKLG
jgi:cytochrome c553